VTISCRGAGNVSSATGGSGPTSQQVEGQPLISRASPRPRPGTLALAPPRSLPAGVVWFSQGPLRAPTPMPPPAPVIDDTGPNYGVPGLGDSDGRSRPLLRVSECATERRGSQGGGSRDPGCLGRPRRHSVTEADRRARRRGALVRRGRIGRSAAPIIWRPGPVGQEVSSAHAAVLGLEAGGTRGAICGLGTRWREAICCLGRSAAGERLGWKRSGRRWCGLCGGAAGTTGPTGRTVGGGSHC
jgi:hypothetical protein